MTQLVSRVGLNNILLAISQFFAWKQTTPLELTALWNIIFNDFPCNMQYLLYYTKSLMKTIQKYYASVRRPFLPYPPNQRSSISNSFSAIPFTLPTFAGFHHHGGHGIDAESAELLRNCRGIATESLRRAQEARENTDNSRRDY